MASWGAEAICLRLPGVVLSIQGLSTSQQSVIARDYESFVVGRSEALGCVDVVCRAGRLARPVGLPPEHFLVDGEYAPEKRRSDAGIEVTGFEFVAHFGRGGPAPSPAALSVAQEGELARLVVLGNFLRILLAYHALTQGGVLLHSAGVVLDGRAYLFCGRSNAGKTTLSHKAAVAGARVLSDDINLVIPERGDYRAHKVPFTGEFGRRAENPSGCESFPLGGLALLEKAPELTAAPVSPAAAVAGLLTGCPFVNDDPEELSALMDVLTGLVSHTPVIRMGLAREDPFDAVMETMVRCCAHD